MVTPRPPRPFRGMRRLTLTGAGTATVLVLLFSYRTSTGDSGTDTPQALAPAQVVSGTPGTEDPATTAGGDTPTTTQDSGGAAGSAGPTATEQPTAETSEASTPPTAPTAAASAGSTTPPTTPTTSSASSGSVTVDGSQEMTRYGVVQVEVTITDGRISDVNAVQYPNRERRDVEINDQALPLLRSEVLSAQSANVDAISGATYTSEGYLTSLQAALDAVGFKS